MAMMAVVFPIMPAKTEAWRAFADELAGSRREEFQASRRDAGVHERTFFQSTPMGDLVIVTLEGDDPSASFGRLLQQHGDFADWFLAHASDLHGFDLSQVPAGDPSELVIDSEPTAVAAG